MEWCVRSAKRNNEVPYIFFQSTEKRNPSELRVRMSVVMTNIIETDFVFLLRYANLCT